MKDIFSGKFRPKMWVHIIHGSALYMAKSGVYAFTHWLIIVCALTGDATLAYQDDALTN